MTSASFADDTVESTKENQGLTKAQKTALATAVETAKSCRRTALSTYKIAKTTSTSKNIRTSAKENFKIAIKSCNNNFKSSRILIIKSK